MSKEELITITEEYFHVSEKTYSIKDTIITTKTVNKEIFLQAIAECYTTFILAFLMSDGTKRGQDNPVYFHGRYIRPYILCYSIIFLIVTSGPFLILRYILATDRDMFPIQNHRDKPIFAVVVLNWIFTLAIPYSLYTIVGPAYYLQYRYYNAYAISYEAVLGGTYVFALIISYRFWLMFFIHTYRTLRDTFTMWKFTILQIRQQRRDVKA